MRDKLVGKVFIRTEDSTRWRVHSVYQDIVYVRSIPHGIVDCPSLSELEEDYTEEKEGGAAC